MERSRETRLGIVMSGGVSLAVYENGVAQELFRAVRSDAPLAGFSSATPTIYSFWLRRSLTPKSLSILSAELQRAESTA